ncbi:MAG: DUF87 domain-containing protein [Oscillospiraceae bacterium]|nr:DUF87 domain-containing protein [Oscillospiraceae bacterium]
MMNFQTVLKKSKTKGLFFGKTMTVPKTAQDTVPFIEAYDNGLFLISENTYTLVFAFDNIDYSLMRDEEQEDIYKKYTKLMNALPADINYQEFIMNSKVDPEKLRKILVPEEMQYGDLYDDYCSIQEKSIKEAEGASAEKIMLIAMSYKPETKVDNVNILFKYYRELQTFFDLLKINTKQLLTEEVLAVIYQYYHPFDSADFKLPKNIFKNGGRIKDYIVPSMFAFKAKEIEVGAAFTRVLFMKHYDRELDDEFIKDLVDNNFKVAVSKHIKRVEKAAAAEKVRKEIFDVQTSIQKKKANNKKEGTDFIPFRLTERLQELEHIQDQLSSSTMELFEISIFISVSAQTKEELDEVTQSLINKARRHQIRLDILIRQQDKAMDAVLPLAFNKFDSRFGNAVNSYLLSDAVGVLVPFSYRSYFTECGLSYGKNQITNSVIVLDRTDELNSNGFILGTSGSGKSMFTKTEIADVLFRYPEDEIIVIDPEREYLELIKSENFDGEVFKLSAHSDTTMNIFDIDMEYSEDGMSAVALKSSFIVTVVETAKGQPLTAQERSVVDRCVGLAYEKYAKSLNADDLPTLTILYDILNKQPEPEAKGIALALEIYAIGSFKCFAGKTNLQMNKRFLVFDLFEMGEQLRAVGLQIILEYLWQRVIYNKKRGVRTWVWIDEFSIMFTDGSGRETTKSGEFFAQVYKRIRKHGGVVTGATQNIKEVLASRQASLMLGNAEFVILLQQKNSEIKQVTELFELSPSQEVYLKTGEKGTGLIICGNKIIPFSKKIPKCRFYDVISTNFKEQQERMKARTEKEKVSLYFSKSDLERLKKIALRNDMDLCDYILSRCS